MRLTRRVLPLLIGVLVATAVAQTAGASHKVRLNRSTARYASRVLLDRRFSDSYSNRAGGSISCMRKVAFNKRRCRVSWGIGDAGYMGRTRVTLFERRNRARFGVVHYRIHLIDFYCTDVEHHPISQCDRHYHGRGRVGNL